MTRASMCALALVLAVATGACGSDSDDATEETTTTSAAPAAPELDRVAIAADVAALFDVPLDAAECGVAALDDDVLGRWVEAGLDFTALDEADAELVFTAATDCGLTPG